MNLHEDNAVGESEKDEKKYAVIPPNGGWGWVVVACAFYCSAIVDGIQLTFGIFLKDISQSFGTDYSKVALAGSLMFGTHLLVGPLCAGFSTEFGLRPVTITGSVICCCGVGLAYFATSYGYLYFTYGIVGGVGLGLIYMNSLIITGLYFTTLMPVAMGIVVCGTGVGTMVFASLGHFLLTITSWQTSFLIQAGLAGSMGFAAIAFKPLKPVRVRLTVEDGPSRSVPEKKNTSVFIKKEIPTTASLTSIKTLPTLAWDGYLEETIVMDVKRKTWYDCNCCKKCSKCFGGKLRGKKSEVLILSEINKDQKEKRRRSYIERTDLEEGRLPESTNSENSHHRVVFEEIVLDKNKKGFCESLRRTVVTMVDCRLLESTTFLLFTMSGALQMASLLIVYIYEKGGVFVAKRCTALGFSDEMSVNFVIFLGASNTLWRLFLGGIATLPKINYEAVSVSGIIIGGIATMVSGLCDDVIYQFGFCVLFGLGMASFAVFRLILLLDLIESQKVENATGINLLFMGILCVIFPPLFGWIMEVTKSYNAIFMITGVILFASGFMLIGLKKARLEEIEKKRRNNLT